MRKAIARLASRIDFAILEMFLAIVCSAAVGLLLQSWAKMPGEPFEQMPLVFLGLVSALLTVINMGLGAAYLFWRYQGAGRHAAHG